MLVVKVGGSKDIDVDAVVDDVAALRQAGRELVLVHGGAETTNEVATALGHPPEFLTSESGFTSRRTDRRTLEIRIVAAGNSSEQVRFVPLPERTGLQPDPSVSHWRFGRETTEVSTYRVENLGEIASYSFSVEARRRAASTSSTEDRRLAAASAPSTRRRFAARAMSCAGTLFSATRLTIVAWRSTASGVCLGPARQASSICAWST